LHGLENAREIGAGIFLAVSQRVVIQRLNLQYVMLVGIHILGEQTQFVRLKSCSHNQKHVGSHEYTKDKG
jgi:hypothetical protein